MRGCVAYEGILSCARVMFSQRDRSVACIASNSLADSRPADFFRTWDEAHQHNAMAQHRHSYTLGIVALLAALTDDQLCSQTGIESELIVSPFTLEICAVRKTHALHYKTRCLNCSLAFI